MLERECSRERSLEKASKEAKIRTKKELTRAAEPLTQVTEDELRRLEQQLESSLVF